MTRRTDCPPSAVWRRRQDPPPSRLLGAALSAVALAAPVTAAAQTDYYNLDAGRPVRVEDALPVERYAFELQMAPLRLERARGGLYQWEVEPELAYGILPGTHVEVGLPLVWRDSGGIEEDEVGLAGLHLSAFHNLNLETRTFPALAVAAEVLLPVGSFAPDDAYVSVKGIATRTYPRFRVHVNARYTVGPEPGPAAHGAEGVSRWMAGAAVDRAFPLQAVLLVAEVFAERPLAEGADLSWTGGAGVRYQLNPRFALDAGMGRRFAGEEPAWFVTFGSAYAFAVRSLIPLPRASGEPR